MVIHINQNRKNRCGRLLICLLLIALFLTQWTAAGSSAAGTLGINASGNVNTPTSIDPIKKSEDFSAVLYNNRNGLPTSEANAIAQTSDGFLWIGSYAGLIRYDGNNFERLSSTSGIANVRHLYVDSKDRLWIATNDSGVFLLEKGALHAWNRAEGLPSVSIRSVAEDGDGVVYASGAACGVAVFDAKLKFAMLKDERLEGRTIPVLRTGVDGLVYGFTQEGDIFTLKNGKVNSFLDHEDCRAKGIHSIMPDPSRPGRLYIGAEGSEVYYGDLESNFASMGMKDISPLVSVNSLESIDGQVWICAANGIGRLDAEGFHRLLNVPMDNAVEHVMTDFEGNLWFVSSHQGVMKIVRNQFTDIFDRYGLSPTVVNSTSMYGPQLFIGSDNGLIVLDRNKPAESVPVSKAATASGAELEVTDLLEYLDGVRIRNIFRDSKGRLWIPTWRKYGLLRYDNGELTVFTKEDGLFSDAVRMVSECADGSILVANTGGVSIIRDDKVIGSYGEDAGIVNGEILTVTEGFNREIMLGSDGDGIYVITPGETRHIGTEEGLKSDIILRVKRSSFYNVYWIVTGNSLAYMTPDLKVTTIREFPYPNNFDLYENSKGDIWVLSSSGIYIASGQELINNGPLEPVFFGIQSGLPYVATANSCSELTSDGDLYIAGSSGVVRVNVEKPFEDSSEMKIALPFIVADDVRYYPNEAGQFILSAGARKVTIYPYVFSYSLVDPQVSYRLDGFDQTDTTVTRSRLGPVDYTNLKIGAYHFLMTVKDPLGRGAQTVSFQIVKGKEMSSGTVGTIIMLAASLLLMGGILFSTAAYRKRDQLEDRLFFYLILANIVMSVGELLSYLLEMTSIPFSKPLMYLGNTVFYVALSVFPYLLLLYLEYRLNPDRDHMRKAKLLYGIPCMLVILLMLANLWTGWIFSIGAGNVYKPGPSDLTFLPVIPVWLYFVVSLFKVYRINRHLTLLGILLLATRLLWELWFQSISSTSFIYTLVLVCIHLYVMERPMVKEAT